VWPSADTWLPCIASVVNVMIIAVTSRVATRLANMVKSGNDRVIGESPGKWNKSAKMCSCLLCGTV